MRKLAQTFKSAIIQLASLAYKQALTFYELSPSLQNARHGCSDSSSNHPIQPWDLVHTKN